jgi:hypothetical protein
MIVLRKLREESRKLHGAKVATALRTILSIIVGGVAAAIAFRCVLTIWAYVQIRLEPARNDPFVLALSWILSASGLLLIGAVFGIVSAFVARGRRTIQMVAGGVIAFVLVAAYSFRIEGIVVQLGIFAALLVAAFCTVGIYLGYRVRERIAPHLNR